MHASFRKACILFNDVDGCWCCFRHCCPCCPDVKEKERVPADRPVPVAVVLPDDRNVQYCHCVFPVLAILFQACALPFVYHYS